MSLLSNWVSLLAAFYDKRMDKYPIYSSKHTQYFVHLVMKLLICLFSAWQWGLSFHLIFLWKYFCASNCCCHLCLHSWISATSFAMGYSERVSGQRWPLHFYIINFSCFTGDILIAPESKDFHWAMNKLFCTYRGATVTTNIWLRYLR